MTRGFNYSTTDELLEAMQILHAKGATSLVLDLRTALRRLGEIPEPAKRRGRKAVPSMRRLLRPAAVGALALWLAAKLRGAETSAGDHVSIGYADGSSVTLEDGSPERELLLSGAAGVW